MKKNLNTKQWAIVLLFALLAGACGSKKTGLTNNEAQKQTLDGYRAHRLATIPLNQSDRQNMKIEIIPGKTMEVDCNHHSLMGEFSEKKLSDGNEYYVFESNGQAVSTLMACPDNSKHADFVQGQSILLDVNTALPPLVYTSEGIDIKQQIWNASASHPIEKHANHTIETEATQALQAYPESLEGYDRYILLLPDIKNAMKERKIEIIPGITMEVDCNHHFLTGSFVEKSIDGWGYTYLVFESSGEVGATLMACPDDSKRTEVVTGPSHLMDYNSRLPIVVFVPLNKDFSVQYRVWETGK